LEYGLADNDARTFDRNVIFAATLLPNWSTPEASDLTELLSGEPWIDDEPVSTRFGGICPALPVLADFTFKSTLAVRFEYAACSKCVLFVGDTRDTCELSFADLSVLEELAKHCSTSLTRASMREQLTRARDGVSQIAIDLALGDHEHALEHVVEGIRQVTDCDAVTLYTIRAVDHEIKAPPTTVGLRDPIKPGKYVRPVLDSPVGRVLKKNRLHTADDAMTDEVMLGGFVGRERIKSSAGTPIWIPTNTQDNPEDTTTNAQERTDKIAVGVLFVNYRTPHTFVGADEKIIRMVANLAAVAIRNQELFNEERRKATVLKCLYDASKAISGTFDLSDILKELAEKALQIVETLDRKGSHVAIALFQNGKAKILSAYPPNNDVRIKVGEEIDLEPINGKRGIVGRTFKDGQSQFVGDVSLDSDFRVVSDNTKSQMVVVIGEETYPAQVPVGAITIESPKRHAFDEEDFLACKSLAALANDAIRNAQQFAEREYALAREENLKDLALYYVKCGILIHNQKAHIEAIRQDAQKLETYVKKYRTLPAEVQIAIGMVNRNSQATDEIRNLAELSAIDWTAIDVEDFVRGWEERLKMRGDVGDIDIDVDSVENAGKRIRVDLLLMKHLLKIFVDNSVATMRAVFDKKLLISVRSTRRSCMFAISDSGRGINRERWHEISSGKNPVFGDPRPRKGLRTALLIATGFGGEIRLLKTSRMGTTFELKLPLLTEAG